MSQGAFRICIETTLSGYGLAIADQGNIQVAALNLNPQASTGKLAGELAGLLAAAQISWHQVASLCVSTGPGSFTGIRMGLAFVYGLSMAQPHVKMGVVSALELLAGRLSDLRHKPCGLLLPQTQTHGFLATPGVGESKISVKLVCYDTIGPFKGLLLVPQVRFAAEALRACPLGEVLDGEEAVWMSLQLMASTAMIAELETLPQPNYMRLSTAEEKRDSEPQAPEKGMSCH